MKEGRSSGDDNANLYTRGVNESRAGDVGDGHPVCSTDEVQLHPVDVERTPPHPVRSRKTCGLSDLPGVKRAKQGGVDQKGLRGAHQLEDDLPSQELYCWVGPSIALTPVNKM